MREAVLSILVFALLLVYFPTTTHIRKLGNKVAARNSPGTTMPYENHEPIVISSNHDFERQGWPGSGTQEDPYIIEGFNITAYSNSVLISDTTAYFEIRECHLSTKSPETSKCVYFEDAKHGRLRDCRIQSGSVYLSQSTNITIENNVATETSRAFVLWDSANCTILDNAAHSCSGTSFLLYSSENCILSNNTASNGSACGFYLLASHGCRLLNNTAVNNAEYNIYLDSRRCELLNNTLVGKGLQLRGDVTDDWIHVMENNTVDGMPIKYLKTINGTIFGGQEYGQIILANCTNCNLHDAAFSVDSAAIQAGYSKNCLFENITISDARTAVYLSHCHECNFTNSRITNCTLDGFSVSNSNYCQFANNNISGSGFGFHSDLSDNCSLVNNTFVENEIAISLEYATGTTIENNTLSRNGQGCVVDYSHYCVLIDNTVDNNTDGVFLDDSSNCLLINNTFLANGLRIIGTDAIEWRHDMAGNTVNEKPLGFFRNVKGDTINGSEYGQIILCNCSDIRVENGIFENLSTAIHLGYSENCTLANVTGNENHMNGILLQSCRDCTVANSTANENSENGFSIISCDDCEFENNIVNDNSEDAFGLWRSTQCSFTNNTLTNNGMYIRGGRDDWSHEISGTTVDGKPLGYFDERVRATIDADMYGQIILAFCSDVTVKDGAFTKGSGTLELGFCASCIVENITVSNSAHEGIFVYISSGCELRNNTVSKNGDAGVLLEGSNDCTLLRNMALDNSKEGFGVETCDIPLLKSNLAIGNEIGFWLDWSHDARLRNNTASTNSKSGFLLFDSRESILSFNTAIENSRNGFTVFGKSTNLLLNRASKNSGMGFSIGSSYNLLTKNTAEHNGESGIFLGKYADGNLLYWNRLGYNKVTDAFDQGDSNIWNADVNGNFWSEYDGEGVYAIPGTAGSLDNNPFAYDYELPLIDHPPDIVVTCNGPQGNYVIWNPCDWNPDRYEVYRNTSIVESGPWNGSAIRANIDGLSDGIYNYTVAVYDTEGNKVMDTVYVSVISFNPISPPTTETTTTEIDDFGLIGLRIIIGFIAGGVIVVIIMAEYLEKRNRV
ncbi:MAG: right-handed parallel beta-helix repeat-containing protein [Candidatus Thorarchaeota archaeon]|nr:right-handed parallel beta-helix repeat-containing protein [Candidatus Thorarchaeota archaeon]